MGNKDSKPMVLKSFRKGEISCTDDLMCQNIDSKKSVPGQDLVLVCPDAKCVSGKCSCGDNCTRDPYTGMCCTRIEERVVQTPMGEEKTTFCIEGSDDASSEEAPKGLLESFSVGQVFGSSTFSSV